MRLTARQKTRSHLSIYAASMLRYTCCESKECLNNVGFGTFGYMAWYFNLKHIFACEKQLVPVHDMQCFPQYFHYLHNAGINSTAYSFFYLSTGYRMHEVLR